MKNSEIKVFIPPYIVHDSFTRKVFEEANLDKQKVNWGLEHLIPDLWQFTKGKGIKVAVLDTGVSKHRDLGKAVVECANYTDEKEITKSHGTLVAGIIGARDNEFGVVGVAPECEIYSAKVLKNRGTDTIGPIIKGFEWALEKKVDIISMSLHFTGKSNEMHDLIIEANKRGIFVICSAGNKGSSLNAVNYPGKYKETIAVGSVGYADKNYIIDPDSSRGEEVDVVAPGVGICSTYLNDTYETVSGTSFSTPFVSGVVALMLSKHRAYDSDTPLNDIEDLRAHLKKTSVDLPPCGRDINSGDGLINPQSLLRNIKTTDLK